MSKAQFHNLSQCEICNRRFKFAFVTVGRHHCRACGISVCGDCWDELRCRNCIRENRSTSTVTSLPESTLHAPVPPSSGPKVPTPEGTQHANFIGENRSTSKVASLPESTSSTSAPPSSGPEVPNSQEQDLTPSSGGTSGPHAEPGANSPIPNTPPEKEHENIGTEPALEPQSAEGEASRLTTTSHQRVVKRTDFLEKRRRRKSKMDPEIDGADAGP